MMRVPVRPRPFGAVVAVGLCMSGLAGCERRHAEVPVAASPRRVVGAAWQNARGDWFYPREQTDYHATGLAVVETPPRGGLTTNGERFDPEALGAAHQTLQLPCIVRVTNLQTGLSLAVRVDNRGPDDPGRLIALTPRAAALLGMTAGTPARVAVALDEQASQAASDRLEGGNQPEIARAPVEGVEEQSLDAPGAPAHPAGRVTAASASPPDRLPELALPQRAEPGPVDPGALWIDAGRFGQRRFAEQVAAAIGGTIRTGGIGRQTTFNVRSGPFQEVGAADAALDQARHAGVTGAHIIVE